MEARVQTCAACGDRIGVYEPLWWHRPDGAVVASSLLRVRDDPAFGPDAVLRHHACTEPPGDRAWPFGA